jgi:hypothetical protein
VHACDESKTDGLGQKRQRHHESGEKLDPEPRRRQAVRVSPAQIGDLKPLGERGEWGESLDVSLRRSSGIYPFRPRWLLRKVPKGPAARLDSVRLGRFSSKDRKRLELLGMLVIP